jgi:hypothetical protein
MPYRDSAQALSERYDALERELRASREHTRSLDELRAREARIAAELSEVARKLGELRERSRRLPLLDSVRIASQCNASWEKMQGDERVRFCGDCSKNVYNISAMAAEEAEALLASRLNGEICVRLYRRDDGTVLTEDCPVGVKKKRRRKLAFGIAGAGALAAAAVTSSLYRTQRTMGTVACPTPVMGEPAVMGSVAAPVPSPRTVDVPAPKEGTPTIRESSDFEMGQKAGDGHKTGVVVKTKK